MVFLEAQAERGDLAAGDIDAGSVGQCTGLDIMRG